MSSEQISVTVAPAAEPVERREVVRQGSIVQTYWGLYRNIPVYMCAVLLVYGLMYGWFHEWSTIEQGDRLILDTNYLEEPWRLWTYSLLHADVPHIVNNCVIFFLLVLCLNVAHGNVRVMGLHTLGAIGGAFGVIWEKMIWEQDTRLRVVGASGSVYALMGGHVGEIAINWGEMNFRWIRLALILYMVISDIIMYFFFFSPLISYSCHVAGFVTGGLLGPLLLKNVRLIQWERYLKWGCALTALSLTAVSVGFNVHLALTE